MFKELRRRLDLRQTRQWYGNIRFRAIVRWWLWCTVTYGREVRWFYHFTSRLCMNFYIRHLSYKNNEQGEECTCQTKLLLTHHQATFLCVFMQTKMQRNFKYVCFLFIFDPQCVKYFTFYARLHLSGTSSSNIDIEAFTGEFLSQDGCQPVTFLYNLQSMQVKQHAPPRRDAAVLPWMGAVFFHPYHAMPEKPPGITGWVVMGTCVFRYEKRFWASYMAQNSR